VSDAEHDRRWLHAGRVGKPHGLDGSFHVTGANAQLLRAAERLAVAGAVREIDRRAGHDGHLILRLAGCSNRADAEALRGTDLLVSRDHAPELEADEWWAEDLQGCAVTDGARRVGTVRQLLALPSCEVLEVERTGGGDALLVPLVSDAVRRVDLEKREIDVDLAFLGED
jgi:16S rRNA processing protein RimM